jgi:glycosyltransferase involved in cell wall biosynthesis
MKVLLINQCFYPDVVSTAQHLTDFAVRLVEEGHEVTVIAGQRGYDDPEKRFPKRELWKGINIIRISSINPGKRSRWRRAVNFGSFIASCALRMATLKRFDCIVALTSPPLISFLAALFSRIRGGRYFFWVMDLNPDEAIAAGWLKNGSLTARALKAILGYSLTRAEKIIVLDRFMKQRITNKGIAEDKLSIIPPWSHDDAVKFDSTGRECFRIEHGLAGKFVVMYSGNHSPCHPLDTLLGAARELSARRDIIFCFVGGGSELSKVRAFVKEHGLENILTLPYQPIDKLAASLSAADLHVVVMGDPFVGIIHPCKIYNILLTGIPFLYIGPEESHVTEIAAKLEDRKVAYFARHGEVGAAARNITECAAKTAAGAGFRPGAVIATAFSKETLLSGIIRVLEPRSSQREPEVPRPKSEVGQSFRL